MKKCTFLINITLKFVYCANTNGGGVNKKSHCLEVAHSFKIYKYFLYDNSNNTGLFIIVGEGSRNNAFLEIFTFWKCGL